MHAALVHEAAAEGQPLRGVVVAADKIHLQLPPGKLHQELVQQRHGFRRRHGFIVDVSGDEYPVRCLPVDDLQNLPEDIALIVQHGKAVDPLA